jgi:hypothetical protein
VLEAGRNEKVTEPWAEAGLGVVGPADGGLRLATAGGTIVLEERVVPRGVSYRLPLEGSLGAVMILEPGPRRTVGLDTVSYLPIVVVKPVAVSYRSLVLSDLREGMLGMTMLAVSPEEGG